MTKWTGSNDDDMLKVVKDLNNRFGSSLLFHVAPFACKQEDGTLVITYKTPINKWEWRIQAGMSFTVNYQAQEYYNVIEINPLETNK